MECEPFRAHTPPLPSTASAPLLPTPQPDPFAPETYGTRLAAASSSSYPRRPPAPYAEHAPAYGRRGERPYERRPPAYHRGEDVEDGEITQTHSRRRRSPELRVSHWGAPPEPARSRDTIGAVFIRLRSWREHQWYEFLMTASRGGAFEFPTTQVDADKNGVEILLRDAARRGLMFVPSDPRAIERCFQQEVVVDGTKHRVYLVPLEATQKPRRDRILPAHVGMAWACESELSSHTQMGPPSVLGRGISRTALAVLAMLPMHLKFASSSPPLVLYHGTDAASAPLIASTELKPRVTGKPAMLGKGVYFARWEKASQFAMEDAEHVPRSTPGFTLRCLVFARSCVTLTREHVCKCGCDKPFLDHDNTHSKGFDMAFVPDNSLPATRRAEWCVYSSGCILLDGMYK